MLKRSISLVALLALLATTLVTLPACTGTKAAYSAAESISDTAYVVTEHYAAVVKEAASLAQNPATPREAVEAMKTADQLAKPLVLGLRPLAEAYDEAKTADNEIALQTALNKAVVALTSLINAVKGART